LEEGVLSKELLENNRCYLLDCGSDLFVWFGKVTQIDDRKAITKAAEVDPCALFKLEMRFVIPLVVIILKFCKTSHLLSTIPNLKESLC
jgi:Gelsolin repeat